MVGLKIKSGELLDMKLSVMDILIDTLPAKQAIQKVTEYMKTDEINTVEIINENTLICAHQSEELKHYIEEQDLVLISDRELLEAAGMQEDEFLQEIENRTFFKLLFHYFHKNQSKIYILADRECQIEALLQVIKNRYKGISIVDILQIDENCSYDRITNQINGAESDCVISFLASPRQEEFISKYAGILNVRLWVGMGNADILGEQKESIANRILNFLGRFFIKREVEKERKRREE